MKKPELQPGTYRHYKGDTYEVVDVVWHTEMESWHVLYRAISYTFTDDAGNESLFVRPIVEFTDTLTCNDKNVKRFTYLE